MLTTILIIILILVLFGVVPHYGPIAAIGATHPQASSQRS